VLALAADAGPAHVRATLLAAQAWARPGRPLTLGVRLQMDPEWHTYWKNPGDSGLATRIRWTLPAGFEVAPILWPKPERFVAGPLASYGYSGEVLLLSEVRTPAAQSPGAIEIAARVDWLECRDVCRPGRADLSLRLEVKSAEAPPVAEVARAFTETRTRLPRARSPWSLAATPTAGSVVLTAHGAAAAPREAYFFPARADWVEHAAVQTLTAEPAGFRLRIPLGANAKLPETVEGVLVADGMSFEVAVRVGAADLKGGAR
jgi:DsbC/DsbD-like thiol-disulfide interchange protein